ncbi:MAG: 2-polyprenyl-3-methyl-6-methoxy-1,4-benzoquinone monooxygenase [Pseudomonadales bacterium]
MASKRSLSLIDQCLSGFDRALKTVAGGAPAAQRSSPAADVATVELNAMERKHVAGLMRVNHTGEVCAQALYKGQALGARSKDVREAMQNAAAEEVDHLAWCEQRIHELEGHTSYLNPLWYGLSFSMGALAGAVGDKVSLGFIAATEDQVCEHLQEHLDRLPPADNKSRVIIEQMLEDEAQHAEHALESGGQAFPLPVKRAMTGLARVMTRSSYRI